MEADRVGVVSQTGESVRDTTPVVMKEMKGTIGLTSKTAWLRPLTQAAADITTLGTVRGSRCRTSRDLFTEWATELGFPDYFGRNWDAFSDCLGEAVARASAESASSEGERAPLAVIVQEADELLADEPASALWVFLNILGQNAGKDSSRPTLSLLLDGTPDRLSRVTERMTEAGYPPLLRGHLS